MAFHDGTKAGSMYFSRDGDLISRFVMLLIRRAVGLFSYFQATFSARRRFHFHAVRSAMIAWLILAARRAIGRHDMGECQQNSPRRAYDFSDYLRWARWLY